MRATRVKAFTLVELLVVIAIIGVLVALLLPVIQAARESARRSQCQSQLKQLGLAVQSHHDALSVLPMGRDRTDQRSLAWSFRILPYLELGNLYEIYLPGTRLDALQNSELMQTPIEIYACPSRRAASADRDFDNDDNPPALRVRGVAASGDYAACAGYDFRTGIGNGIFRSEAEEISAGPIHSYSTVEYRQITDGLSATFALGERHIADESTAGGTLQRHYQLGDTAFLSGDLPRTIFAGTQGGLATDLQIARDESNARRGS